MDRFIIDPRTTRDIASLLLDEKGSLRILPASFYAQTTRQERAMFGVLHAYYGLPTVELVEFLAGLIDGRSALEIGAGTGVLARALGIRATDSWQQDNPAVKAYYSALKQPTIRYGADVERIDALSAVAKYKPSVVVGSWVTHRYDPRRHAAGGNQDGILEENIIAACDAYIVIGNERVHENKSIWSLPHEKLNPPWLYSRAANGSPDFIAIWRRPKTALD